MEDFYFNNISRMESNNSNVTYSYNYDYSDYIYISNITYVITCIIISIGLPLTLVAIYSLYSQVQNNNVGPIFIINLLISDIIQLCYMIFKVVEWRIYEIYYFEAWKIHEISYCIYCFGVVTSVAFMVCIALERYLVIAWPVWYRFRRTIKISLVVCAVVWILPFGYVLPYYFGVEFVVLKSISAIFLLIPFPLLIFFLVGTLKVLSTAISVPSDEKRRIVGMLVLVLLIYMLLFLPAIIWFIKDRNNYSYNHVTHMLLRFSPLADLILYVFMRKGVIDKLLTSLCCCRMDSNGNSLSV